MQTINEPIILLDVLYCTNGFTEGVDATAIAEQNCIMATTTTSAEPIMQDSLSRVCINATMIAKGAQHGTAQLGVLYNHSTDGRGCTALYGKAVSSPTSFWSAGVHGETRHAGGTSIAGSFEVSEFSPSGNSYGVVVNNTTGGNRGEKHEITQKDYEVCQNSVLFYGTGADWTTGIKFNCKFRSGRAIDILSGGIFINNNKVVGERVNGFKKLTSPPTAEDYNKLLEALMQHGLIGL